MQAPIILDCSKTYLHEQIFPIMRALADAMDEIRWED